MTDEKGGCREHMRSMERASGMKAKTRVTQAKSRREHEGRAFNYRYNNLGTPTICDIRIFWAHAECRRMLTQGAAGSRK